MTLQYGGPEIRRTHRTNPSEILQKLIERHPDAVFEEILESFEKKVRGNDDLLAPIIRYFARNGWSDYRRAAARHSPDPERSAVLQRQVAENVRKIKNIIIGELEMPNGKMVKDCTGTEMKRFGAAWQRIGEAAGRKRVGDVLSEQEMRGLVD